jgi:Tol biopolymer transport system component
MRFLLVAALAARALSAQDPQPFTPGAVSDSANELSPAFAPDGKTVWFTISDGNSSRIVISELEHGEWTAPVTAAFSGQWSDLEAAMAPDGSYLIFASNRPAPGGTAPLDGNYSGKVQPGHGGNLWRVDRHGEQWGTPVRLPDVINASTSVFSPAIAKDGSLYFMKASPETGRFQLYRAQFASGQYQAAERVSFSDEQWSNVDPAVAPDESFIVFSSNRPPTVTKDIDLFIAFRTKNGWDTPVSLGSSVNSPSREIEARLGADHHTLYFSSNRGGPMRMWRTDLSSWLKGSSARPR